MEGQPEQITRSSRDPEVLRTNFEQWLAGKLPGRSATVTDVRIPESNGMSSETLLLDAIWNDDDGQAQAHHLVARVAPADVDIPVFSTYDLSAQFQVMQLVGANSDVPVPATLWLEEDPGVVDAVFFVMERVDGRVPPDNLPYTFEGWLLDATSADRRHLQDATAAVLAGIHAIDLAEVAASGTDTSFLSYHCDGDTPLRKHVQHWHDYYEWMRGDTRLPLAEAAFAWLDNHWPSDEGTAVLTWGDARIGNMIYQGFAPAAVLDWEMAGIGPAGIDVGWMMFLHTFFQDLAEMLELPGLPDMFQPDDVMAAYVAAGGTPIADLDFYIVYAALRHALVMARVHTRRVHFGEAQDTGDPDDAIMHRARLTQLLQD